MRGTLRRIARQGLGPALLVVLTLGLRPLDPSPTDVALSYLLAVLAAAAAGGLVSGAAVSLGAALALDYFFLPPLHTLVVGRPADRFALAGFLVAAAVSSLLVARAAERSRQAERRARQTQRLLDFSQAILGGPGRPDDVAGALRALAADAARALGAERAWIEDWTPGEVPGPGLPAWCADVLRGLGPDFPRHPAPVRGPGGGRALVLPLGRRSGQPALLFAAGPGMDEALAEGVAGLGSLALERLYMLRAITAAEAVRRSDELKSALLSSVSHELRTPLAAIRVAATALQRPGAWRDAANRDELLRTLDEEANRLNRVIANLLCMSRIEAGALVPERRPCVVEALVWEGALQARPRLPSSRLVLSVPDGLPLVDCDPGLAAIALANLLDNAAKYSPEDEPVEVGGRVSDDGSLVAVWVDDRGPGIPPGEAERIFDRFHRATARARAAGPQGTGLGLSIARALVEAHGGRLWAEGRPGGGSRFTATWPVAATGGR